VGGRTIKTAISTKWAEKRLLPRHPFRGSKEHTVASRYRENYKTQRFEGFREGKGDERWLEGDSRKAMTMPTVAKLEFVEGESATYDDIFRVEFKWL